MRSFYSVLFHLLIPFVLLRLYWRGKKAPDYRLRWSQRLGFYGSKQRPAEKLAWFHAVSVGEAEAVFPLIRRLLERHPQTKLLVTTTTPTGSARVMKVLGDKVEHVYLPYDVPFAVNRFMSRFRPTLAVIMETEIWPNLFHYCGQNDIPLYLINARLSENSARGYKKASCLIRPALQNVAKIAAQTAQDAERYRTIGADPAKITVLGNVKFDLDIVASGAIPEQPQHSPLFGMRYVLMAASTHQGEEQMLMEVYRRLKSFLPSLLLAIAPRHPERFPEVAEFCAHNRLNMVQRTSGKPVETATDVYLIDTIGELKTLMTLASVAFIGGSLVKKGGHNILESLAAGVPTIFGPHMDNFRDIAAQAVAREAAIQCAELQALKEAIQSLYQDESKGRLMSENGMEFLQQNQGATERVYQMLAQHLKAQ